MGIPDIFSPVKDLASNVKDIASHVAGNVLGSYGAVFDLISRHKLLAALAIGGTFAGLLATGSALPLLAAAVWLAVTPAMGAVAADLVALALSWLKGQRPSWEALDRAARLGGVMNFTAVASLLAISGALLLVAPAATASIVDAGAYVAVGAAVQSELTDQGGVRDVKKGVSAVLLWPLTTVFEVARIVKEGASKDPAKDPAKDELPAGFEDDPATQGGESPRSRGLVGALSPG